MINSDAIAKMKDGVVILNFARDLLVDEEAVLRQSMPEVHRYVSDFPKSDNCRKTRRDRDSRTLEHPQQSPEENCAVMAVKELRNFLETVKYQKFRQLSNCDLGICESASALLICHKNAKGMISRFTDVLADTNIRNMSNASKGDFAYTLLDLDSAVSPGGACTGGDD